MHHYYVGILQNISSAYFSNHIGIYGVEEISIPLVTSIFNEIFMVELMNERSVIIQPVNIKTYFHIQ